MFELEEIRQVCVFCLEDGVEGEVGGGHVMTTVITLKVIVTHVREGKGGRGVIRINIAGGRGVGGGVRNYEHYCGG